MIDERGPLRLPVPRQDDPLVDQLRSLAARYVALLAKLMPVEHLVALTGVDRASAFAMACHDISWYILAEFVPSAQI